METTKMFITLGAIHAKLTNVGRGHLTDFIKN